MITSPDVRSCPNSECDYMGIVQIDPITEQIECTEPFTCDKCDQQWRDPLQRQPWSLKNCLSAITPDFEKVGNFVRIVMIAEPCPNCGVMVQKNGGCPHMMCSKCKYEFCWSCLGSYKRYRHAEGFEKYCGQAHMMYASIYFTVGLVLVIKLIQASPWSLKFNDYNFVLLNKVANLKASEFSYYLAAFIGINAYWLTIATNYRSWSRLYPTDIVKVTIIVLHLSVILLTD